MKNRVLTIIRNIIIAILCIILLINTFIIVKSILYPNKVPGIFGYKPFIVLSNSMENEIKAGDLVIVKEVDSSTLKEKDIIAFRDKDNTVTTHRIVEKVKYDKDDCFTTKGDNNNTNDNGPICSKDIEGKLIKVIPVLGHIILFIQQPYGIAIMILALIIVSLLIYNSSKEKLSKEELEEFKEFKKKKKEEAKEK